MSNPTLRRCTLFALALALLAFTALPAAAQPAKTFNVTITNLTPGQVLSPPIVVSHSNRLALWRLGSPASPELAAVAEDADASGLLSLLSTLDGVLDFTVAGGGPLPPGTSRTVQIDALWPHDRITVLGMLVTTNDAFYGVTSDGLPFRFQTDGYSAVAYDAGSEANTESCTHIPGPPCGNAGVRVTDGAEGFVHVHNGVHGVADLNPAMHDWHNPVAHVAIHLDR